MNEYNIIGDRYFNGDGVEQNYETAFNNYLKAAEMEDPEGYSNLAWCYEHGLGTERSETNAIVNYTKAGEMGLAKAWRNLAFMLFFSVTDDNDPKLADSFKYMLKAADMGDAFVILKNSLKHCRQQIKQSVILRGRQTFLR